MSRVHAQILSLCLVAATGCGNGAEEKATDIDESKFTIGRVSPDLSILPAIEQSNGAPEVCLGLIGFEDGKRQAAAEKLKALVSDAASKWNALLDDDDDWSFHGNVEPRFSVHSRECAKNGPGFSVNLWATATKFKADYCARPGYTCASGAIPGYRTLYLGPWNRDERADPFDPFATLHEYGHLLGLGDTYKIPGAHDWVGQQPDSVMNAESETLTDDDKLGLWVVVRTLKTGVRSCRGFGTRVRMTHNEWDSLVCDPSSTPVRSASPSQH